MVWSIIFIIYLRDIFMILGLLFYYVRVSGVEVLVHLLKMSVIKILRFCSEFIASCDIHQCMFLRYVRGYEKCLIFLLFFYFVYEYWVLNLLINNIFTFFYFRFFFITIFNHYYISIIFVKKRNLKFGFRIILCLMHWVTAQVQIIYIIYFFNLRGNNLFLFIYCIIHLLMTFLRFINLIILISFFILNFIISQVGLYIFV